MQVEIDKIIDEFGDTVSVYAKNLSDEKVIVSHRCNKVFGSPIVMRMMIMVEALKAVEEGRYTLDENIDVEGNGYDGTSLIKNLSKSSYTLKDLILLMMSINDYSAVNTLLNLLGMENINRRAQKMGFMDTKIRRFMLDFNAVEEGRDNVTSIRDMANLLEKIHKRKLFKSKELSDLSVQMLEYQKVGRGVAGYLPGGENSYKSGEVAEFYHDIGIVFLENSHFILGVFVDQAIDPIDALDIVSRVKRSFLRKINKGTL